MDQEAQFLAALQIAASYEIEGSVLQLRTKDDALAAMFNKK
jgi:heat shock protein HslJ